MGHLNKLENFSWEEYAPGLFHLKKFHSPSRKGLATATLEILELRVLRVCTVVTRISAMEQLQNGIDGEVV